MKKPIVKNTLKILSLFVAFQMLTTVLYYLSIYVLFIPISEMNFGELIVNIYLFIFPILSTMLMIIVFYKYGFKHIDYTNKKQIITVLAICFVIASIYESVILSCDIFHDYSQWFFGVNPIAMYYVNFHMDFSGKARIPLVVLVVVVENIANLTALYYGAKKKKDSKIEMLDDTVILEDSDNESSENQLKG